MGAELNEAAVEHDFVCELALSHVLLRAVEQIGTTVSRSIGAEIELARLDETKRLGGTGSNREGWTAILTNHKSIG